MNILLIDECARKIYSSTDKFFEIKVMLENIASTPEFYDNFKINVGENGEQLAIVIKENNEVFLRFIEKDGSNSTTAIGYPQPLQQYPLTKLLSQEESQQAILEIGQIWERKNNKKSFVEILSFSKNNIIYKSLISSAIAELKPSIFFETFKVIERK